jgi:hypothetical protein
MKRFDFRAALLALAATVTQLPASVVTWQELLNKTQPAEGLLDSPETFADIVPPQAVPAEGLRFFTDMMRDLYATFDQPPSSHYFFCTIYYTPLETGFCAERGFDLTPTVMKGSGGRKFAADFVRSVIMEGFGRLAEPVGGKRRRGDVEAPLPLDPAAGLAGGVDDKKGAQAGPGVALL